MWLRNLTSVIVSKVYTQETIGVRNSRVRVGHGSVSLQPQLLGGRDW